MVEAEKTVVPARGGSGSRIPGAEAESAEVLDRPAFPGSGWVADPGVGAGTSSMPAARREEGPSPQSWGSGAEAAAAPGIAAVAVCYNTT